MKKIGKKIILFFDKWLITPITKLILLITDFVKDHGREIEKFINKKQTLNRAVLRIWKKYPG